MPKTKRKKATTRTRKIGRPSTYNEEIASKLCLSISTSSKGLRRICSENPKFPNPSTVYHWITTIPAFHAQYARAREFQSQRLFDELIELADKPRMGVVTKIDSRGRKEKRIADMTDRARLQIDTRKWALSKLLPKKYGDRIEAVDDREDPLANLTKIMSDTYFAKYGNQKPDSDETVQ